MTAIPLPFITALLLLLLAGISHQQLKQTSTGRVFALFLYVNALSMLCIGFRWSHNLLILLPVAAVLAVISAALLFLAFRSLGRAGPVVDLRRDWPHTIPVVLIAILLLIQPHWIELILVATKLVYAGLLLQLAQRAPSSLQMVRLGWFNHSQKALWAATILLLVSVGVDIAIAVDFALYEGRHAAQLVGTVNLMIVLLLGWASVFAGQGQSRVVDAESMATLPGEAPANEDASAEDTQLMHQLNALLIEHRLFADTELNLQKLARKAGVPARTVSRAINTHAGKNVSQWINSARVDAVCDLLKDKDVSVTQAMFEAGFTTKSNFNREFRRLKGCSPSQWRAEI